MKKEKITNYNKDNILGWSEEDFRDVICQMVNVKILSGEPLTPLLNCYYLQENDQWHLDKLELTKNSKKHDLERKIKTLKKELEELNES